MQVEKNGIRKNIDTNLEKDYLDAGWKEVKESKKEVKVVAKGKENVDGE